MQAPCDLGYLSFIITFIRYFLTALSVVCTHEYMMVYLEHTQHPNLDMDRVTLKDVNCKLADLGDFNRTHLWMEAPFDSCMTNHSTEGDTITYANSIIAETRASQGSFLISREFQAEFPFKCTYPRSVILSVASFSPREKVIYTRTGKERSLSPICAVKIFWACALTPSNSPPSPPWPSK